MGNSVFESITSTNYENIYLLFGSKEPDADHILVKYEEYWKVTSDISVTHSPRFKINMNTSQSVFNSLKEYNSLRDKTELQKVEFIQNYLKNHTNGVKWFISPTSINENIKPTSLNSLSPEIQNFIKAQVLILYPQDLISSSRANYARAHEFIITAHFYYSSSFRDFFSAGGKWIVKDVEFPKTVETFYSLKNDILNTINEANSDFQNLAYQSWETIGTQLQLSRNSFLDDYKTVIDFIGQANFSTELSSADIRKFSDLLLGTI